MSRRRRSSDRSLRIEGEQLLEQLDSMFVALSEREVLVIRLRFGLYDGEPWSPRQIAEHVGITREGVDRLEDRVLRKLRYRGDSLGGVRGYLEGDFPLSVSRRASILGPTTVESLVVQCPRHGWAVLHPYSPMCPVCECSAPRPVDGRPRKYCSNACRQSAYRTRNRS